MSRTVILAALCAVLFAMPAEARPKHRVKAPAVECFIFCPEPVAKDRYRSVKIANEGYRRGRILAHPTGCPRRAFCGCGASIRVFGRSIRSLWLARNWFKFPRTSPATKMVAVRNHHVFVLEQHIEGKIWLVYDANSGGGKTRLHRRSIAGYVIVNPHGAMASRGQAL